MAPHCHLLAVHEVAAKTKMMRSKSVPCGASKAPQVTPLSGRSKELNEERMDSLSQGPLLVGRRAHSLALFLDALLQPLGCGNTRLSYPSSPRIVALWLPGNDCRALNGSMPVSRNLGSTSWYDMACIIRPHREGPASLLAALLSTKSSPAIVEKNTTTR